MIQSRTFCESLNVYILQRALRKSFGIMFSRETWPKLAQEFVGLTLSTWNLQVWQSPVMQASFAAVMDMFQIMPGQVGFLAKAGREDQRPNRQPTTAEERWTAGTDRFTMAAHEKSQRSAKRQPHTCALPTSSKLQQKLVATSFFNFHLCCFAVTI